LRKGTAQLLDGYSENPSPCLWIINLYIRLWYLVQKYEIREFDLEDAWIKNPWSYPFSVDPERNYLIEKSVVKVMPSPYKPRPAYAVFEPPGTIKEEKLYVINFDRLEELVLVLDKEELQP
jgi:hypothetical protein